MTMKSLSIRCSQLVWVLVLLSLAVCSTRTEAAFGVHRAKRRTELRVSVSADQENLSSLVDFEETTSTESVSWDWKKVIQQVFAEDERPVILFDGHCNLCNGGVNFALDHDEKASFRFASLQSVAGKSLLIRSGRSPDDMNSIVLAMPDGEAFFESDAVLKIAQNLDGSFLKIFGYAGFLAPGFIRGIVYKIVSENRYIFGEQYDQCRIDYDGSYDTRFVPDLEP